MKRSKLEIFNEKIEPMSRNEMGQLTGGFADISVSTEGVTSKSMHNEMGGCQNRNCQPTANRAMYGCINNNCQCYNCLNRSFNCDCDLNPTCN